MKERTLTKGEQKRVDACTKVVEWAQENRKHRGCIVIATDEKSSTCAMIGESQGLISALLSAIKNTPNFRNILSTALMVDMVTGSSKSDTDGDK